jgi:hypothetical protein
MPTLNSIARIVAKPLPRVVSPRAQSILDYILVGTFLGAAGWFWRRNKRAAVASVLCGAAKLGICMITDYPGGVHRILDYHARREVDLGLAAMVATMPEFMAFKKEPEKKFFLVQGALITAGVELSQYPDHQQHRRKERMRAA